MKQSIIRFLALVALLAAIVWGVNNYQGVSDTFGGLKLYFFDVGQGDSVMFDTPNHHQVVIDGGPDSSVLRTIGQALPLTDKEIDLLIITHNHADHLSGAVEILKHYKVDQIWVSGAIYTSSVYRQFLEIVKEKNIPIKDVTAGQDITIDGLSGVILYPVDSAVGLSPEDQNTLSVVSYWQYGTTTMLETGDLQAEQEQTLLQKGLVKPATILKVGHHGSKTSSSINFLKTVNPTLAVISLSASNTYGFPHQEVMERLRQVGATILRTDKDKTIRFDISQDSYSYKTGI